jgi:hypothetical protein
MAVALSLLLLAAVITMFGKVSESISDSRSLLEMADRLRLAEERLQLDLSGVTVTMNPPRNPANNEGYFEYIEGPIGLPLSGMTTKMQLPSAVAKNTDLSGSQTDFSVGDFDDILMFTTRSTGQPFVGRGGQSYVAEVAWFVRGRTLHRRVLLVIPGAFASQPSAGFYARSDISVHPNGTYVNGVFTPNGTVSPNTLADLTRRECRYAHPTTFPANGCAFWTWTISQPGLTLTLPTLPTLYECSEYTIQAGNRVYQWAPETSPTAFPTVPPIKSLDLWSNQSTARLSDDVLHANTNQATERVSDDIILTNVIGFDVKAWDPLANGGRGAYVDLGYDSTLGSNQTRFSTAGANSSGFGGIDNYHPRIFDTWSTSYLGSLWNDGLDNSINGQPANGIVDDDSEKTNPPPYSVPLRGIQVKIRCFEPDSRQVREVTVVQDFLPK